MVQFQLLAVGTHTTPQTYASTKLFILFDIILSVPKPSHTGSYTPSSLDDCTGLNRDHMNELEVEVF